MLTKPKVKIDKLSLDIWELKQTRIPSTKTRILQRLQPEIVNRIQQLRIQRKRGRRGGAVKNALAYRYANFKNLITVLTSDSPPSDQISSNLVLAMFNQSEARIYF